MTDHPHAVKALQYARDVVEGRIVACKWIILACQRFLDDLTRDDLTFNGEKVTDVCEFVERMPHVKGRWASAGLLLTMEPWQCFILANVFGWYVVDEDAVVGVSRRFRTVYLELARKNAKSTMTSPVGLYVGFAENEAGAEVYSGATARDQARIVFDIANDMARRTPKFLAAFGVESRAHNINSVDSGSKFEPVSSDVKTLDGKNPHMGIIDEYHAHPDAGVFDALRTGMGARENPLMWVITTAGSNLGGPCYRANGYAKKVLDGTVEDDSYFAVVYTIDQPDVLDAEDKGDEWDDPSCWIKANPNLGVSVFERDLRLLCEEAKEDPIKQATFLTKRLNVWVGASQAWMNMVSWSTCGEAFDIADFAGEKCWMGLDLGAESDVSALAVLFERPGEQFYYLGRYFLPGDNVREKARRTHEKYIGWAAAGLFTLTEGNITDQEYIKQEILRLADSYEIVKLGFDSHDANFLMTQLGQEGVNVVKIPQNVAHFSGPMERMGDWVRARKFHHGSDPILTWMMSNVVAKRDVNNNMFPRKERYENKIDGPVAIFTALAARNEHVMTPPSRYNEDPDAEVVVIG